MPTPEQIEAAYQSCLDQAHSHYENFPVASRILPKAMRKPVAVVYAFARQADDMADEGDTSAEERIRQLEEFGQLLDEAVAGATDVPPLFIALADVAASHEVPVQLFHDLLTAFKQDVSVKRYQTHQDVLLYCRYSANPVGRLMLHLAGQANELNLIQSDAICSALQLINFLQDLRQDYDEMHRIYLPLDDLAAHGVSEEHFRDGISDSAMKALFRQAVKRAETLMLSGAPLGKRLKGRFGLEIRLIIGGGLRILHRLKQLEDDVFARPRLRKRDWLWIVAYALKVRPAGVTA